MPGESSPMSSRPSTAAPPRVASRSASRELSAVGSADAPCDEQRLLHLEEEVASFVRSGAVDAEADANAGVEQFPGRRDSRSEAQVRAGAVGDAGACLCKAPDLAVVEMDAVRAPDVVREPAELLEVLDGRAAEALAAERLLLHRFGKVCVELEPELAGELPPTRSSARA